MKHIKTEDGVVEVYQGVMAPSSPRTTPSTSSVSWQVKLINKTKNDIHAYVFTIGLLSLGNDIQDEGSTSQQDVELEAHDDLQFNASPPKLSRPFIPGNFLYLLSLLMLYNYYTLLLLSILN